MKRKVSDKQLSPPKSINSVDVHGNNTDGGLIKTDGFSVTSIGLISRKNTTPEQWLTAGKTFNVVDSAMQWVWGDWIILGKRWGKTYEDAILLSGKEESTLEQYVATCKAFEHHKRIEGLTYHHHEKVRNIKDIERRQKLLRGALNNGWSVAELKRQSQQEEKYDFEEIKKLLNIMLDWFGSVTNTMENEQQNFNEFIESRQWNDTQKVQFNTLMNGLADYIGAHVQ